MKRAAAYARISSDKQNQTSLDAQFDEIQNFADRVGLQIIDKFHDIITASGAKERPEFSRMIENAMDRKYDAIIVFKLDRWERDDIEDMIITRQLESNGIFVFSTSEGFDPTTPSGRFIRNVISANNRFYIENLKHETYKKTTASAKQGFFQGGYPPYGYRLVKRYDEVYKRERTYYEINPEEAPFVKKALEMYAEGTPNKEIVEWLNNSGAPLRRAKSWNVTILSEWARNEKYTGTFVYRKGFKRNLRKERDDTIKVSGAMPAIIDMETWEKIQERRQKNNHFSKNYSTKECILKGMVYCGDCASIMTHSGGSTARYYCSRAKNKKDVPWVSIRRDKANKIVLDYIKTKILDKVTDFEAMAKEYNRLSQEKEKGTSERVINLVRRKEEIQTKIENATNAILEGLAIDGALKERIKKMKEEIDTVDNEIAYLSENKETYLTPEMIEEEYKRRCEMLEGDYESQRALILEMIQKVIIHPNGWVEIIERS